MVLYFTGTGNSEYVAKRIGRALGDETRSLFEQIRGQDFSGMASASPWVVVCPTYAWRIPRVLENWLAGTKLGGCTSLYFVMTCGGGIGNAGAYAERLSASKGMEYCGCKAVVMPENYIALYTAPNRAQALAIIERAEADIEDAICLIERGEKFPRQPVTLRDRLSSGIVNNLYYPLVVRAKKFYATGACVSCGLCETVCPTNNIRLENGKPVWKDCCTHCMACICRCPKTAIEYGNHTRGLNRYTCPKNIE